MLPNKTFLSSLQLKITYLYHLMTLMKIKLMLQKSHDHFKLLRLSHLSMSTHTNSLFLQD